MDRAIADYSRAIEIDPQYGNAFFGRGTAFEAKGDHNRAIADLSKAIEITPQNADAFYDRGLAHRAKGEIDAAIADYTHAIELIDCTRQADNSRSKAFEAKGEFDRASADHKKAVEVGLPSTMSWKISGRAQCPVASKSNLPRAISLRSTSSVENCLTGQSGPGRARALSGSTMALSPRIITVFASSPSR